MLKTSQDFRNLPSVASLSPLKRAKDVMSVVETTLQVRVAVASLSAVVSMYMVALGSISTSAEIT